MSERRYVKVGGTYVRLYERGLYERGYIRGCTNHANRVFRLQISQHPQKLLRQTVGDTSLGLRADGRWFVQIAEQLDAKFERGIGEFLCFGKIVQGEMTLLDGRGGRGGDEGVGCRED